MEAQKDNNNKISSVPESLLLFLAMALFDPLSNSGRDTLKWLHVRLGFRPATHRQLPLLHVGVTDQLQVEWNTEIKAHSSKNYIQERTLHHLLACHFAN